jgi:sigma-B regulation protein RsbU (phosphoserine phosphatase)
MNLRDYERDVAIARDLQAGFLPERLPAPDGWRVAATLRPAGLMAGDFYDGFDLPGGQVGFLVADVCDKGIGAALFMALVRTLLRHTAQNGDPEPLTRAVVATNAYLTDNHRRQGYFVTLFFGVLDPSSGRLRYINCGHNPPVLIRANGSHRLLPPTGPAMGMLPDSDYALGHATLAPGDSLLAYTDGVVEARDPAGRQFGVDRLLAAAHAARPAATMLDAVDRVLRMHVGAAAPSDDITLFTLHRLNDLSGTVPPALPDFPAGR